MIIYIFSLFLILSIWPILKRKKKFYCTFVGIWMSLLAIVRNYSVGADTIVYLQRYTRLGNTDWDNLFKLSTLYSFEYGFSVLNKIMHYVIKSPRAFMIVLSVIIVVVLCVEIYKYSAMPWLSFYIFITSGMYASSLNLLRQFLAISIVFYAYQFIKEQNLFKFIISIFIAATFHVSVLVVLPMYWLVKINYNELIIGITLGATIFLVTGGKYILVKILSLTSYSHIVKFVDGSGDGALGLIIISLVLFFIICVCIWKKSNFEFRNHYIAFGLVSLACSMMTFFSGGFERVLPYFFMMFLISVPNTLQEYKSQRIRMQYLSFIGVLLLFYYIVIVCRSDVSQVIPYEIWDGSF